MESNLLKFNIQIANIKEAVKVAQQIPEFKSPYNEEEYQKRLSEVPYLILVAYQDQKAIGFKVGYEREKRFYTWMGGVLPEYRKYGVAKKLAETQENWAIKNGYTEIELKTWNQATAMLVFAIKSGFKIIKVEPREDIEKNRIILRKKLR